MLLLRASDLFRFTFYAQVLQGAVLPLELVMMLIIINRRRVMGTHINNLAGNVVAWTTAVVIGGLAIVYVIQSIQGALTGG